MLAIFARIDKVDQLILDLEREDIQRHCIRGELLKGAFMAQPNATP
jgi:hypothetical protein